MYFPLSHDGVRGKSIGVPAEELEPGRARISVTPPSAVGAAIGDVYWVLREKDGTWWARRKIESSGYSAVLVIPPDPPKASLLGRFAHRGVIEEDWFGFLVLDMPPGTDLGAVRWMLDAGVREGDWEYEELCVTDAWRA